MQSIHRILVVLNPVHSDSLALRRAKHIARGISAHLHLLLCDQRQDHGALLGSLNAQLSGEGFSVTTQQARCDHLHPTGAILAAQQANACDLVVKQHYPDNPLTRSIMPPEDWRLLRDCPVPVLMTKTERSWEGGLVLAAMDVDNHEGDHLDLQGSIIGHAVDLAALLHGTLHAVTAYSSGFDLAADPCAPQLDGKAAQCWEGSRWFQEEYGLRDHQLHLAEGSARTVIAQYAHELEAAITVIGTVARKGLAGVIIGNTAEAVLDRVDSDVLVLKPHDADVHLLEPLAEQANPPHVRQAGSR
ncbi:universal stress protein [Pseudomonas sp. LPB0260]|uniref:universal stress protein n=1 Tax=Pseudomonas sp. LPB0260 TaxID=2614442 RepID=UPI0015C1FCE7|nr:universal stress protein [Pseudomonas sp. LPB0260]QLC72528.1 universal stress protein [Pseudomonas sp. LPB0260]QLC75304.1 universal stress protein [Pseudomonas sp. LPB0260]